MNKPSKFRLLMLQSRYLKAQLSVDKDTHSISMVEFSKEFNRMMKTLPDEQRQQIQEKTTQNVGPTPDNEGQNFQQEPKKERVKVKPKKTEGSLRRTFQDVAKKTHPDKLIDLKEEERQYKEMLFKQAQKAVEDKDLTTLFDVAEKLNIEVPEPDYEQIDLLKNDIKKIREKIKELKSTASWEWYHASDIDKKAIMTSYMSLLVKGFAK